MVGKATLIKSAVTSIPIYIMQTTLLPQKISHQLDKMSCQFLWWDTAQHKGCHTVNWETVTLPKEAGGLGLTSTRRRNHVILMNQTQCLYTNPSTLWAQVLKAKYFLHTMMSNNTRSMSRSHIYTAFLIGIKFLHEGMSWIVGDGQKIQIWKDSWLS